MKVVEKLMVARVALSKMNLTKSGENKFAGYKYFELGDFLPAAMQMFMELKLGSIISFDSEMATLTIIDLEDQSTVKITSPMADANLKGAHPIQNLGAVESYQRRYLWLAALELVEHDVIDASPPIDKPAEKPPEPKPPSIPKKIVGQEGTFQITVKREPDGDVGQWLEIVSDATKVCLDLAKTEEDVLQIFRKNKQLFEAVKSADATAYKGLMDLFGKKKQSLKEVL